MKRFNQQMETQRAVQELHEAVNHADDMLDALKAASRAAERIEGQESEAHEITRLIDRATALERDIEQRLTNFTQGFEPAPERPDYTFSRGSL